MKMPTPGSTLIFLHIPKNGGSTLRQVIARQYRADQIYLVKNPHDPSFAKFYDLPGEEKRNLKVVLGHFGFGIGESLLQPSRYFTLLRDPIDRAISHYYYICRTPSHTHYSTVVEGKVSLYEFVRSGISKIGSDNGQTRLLGGGPKGADDIPFGHVTREILETAKRNLREQFDVVGLVEQFDTSLLLLHCTFGWKTPWYRSENVALDRKTRRSLAPETLACLRDSNSLDLELYAYGREMFRQQIAAQPPNFHAKLFVFRTLNEHAKLRSLYSRTRSLHFK